MTVPGKPVVDGIGATQKNFPFVGRMLAHIQLYGEWEWGGKTAEDRRTKTSINLGSNIIEGAPYSTGTPPAPLNFKVIPAAQVRQCETSGAGASSWAQSGADNQAFVGAHRRRAASEGSMSLTVAGSLDTERSRRGGEGRGDHECVRKGGGRGSGRFTRRESVGDKDT